MIHPTRSVHHDLDRILVILDRSSLFSFTPEERQSLRVQAKELSDRLASIQRSFLTVGLLGGTGVGKSTLMNALAGSPIASTSHRRPHTEQVLVYRHAAAPVPPPLIEAELPWQEITHHTDSVKQILLCDLPDFDSLLGEHREQVLAFVEHLDLLVWVTSPEKYADGRFYEFLKLVPKAARNFSFVLNKGDLLFEAETQEAGYRSLAGVTGTFQHHIRQQGVAEPLLFSLSAQEVLMGGEFVPWNQFPAFKQHVFQQRDIKEILAIKTANLDLEVRKLHAVLTEEVAHLKTFDLLLGRLLQDLAEQRKDWQAAAREVFEIWLEKYLRPDMLNAHNNPSLLVGPGYALSVILRVWQPDGRDPGRLLRSLGRVSLPEDLAVPLRRRLEWIGERLQHALLRENLSPAYGERLREIVDAAGTYSLFAERCSQVATLSLAEPSPGSTWGFRAVQYLAYLALLFCLLLAIGAETAWRDFLDHPGGRSLLRLTLSVVQTVFSNKGLAALGSYALLNLFVAFRLHRRYRKSLNRRVAKTMETLKAALLRAWSETLEAMEKRVQELRSDISAEIAELNPGRSAGNAERP
jgi:GTPase SAR1 family protein